MSEPWGFRVQLSSLETFAQTVDAVRKDYEALNGQLAAADLTAHDAKLLGLAKLPGSTAVTNECKEVLGAYTSLYGKVAWAQSVIKAQLDNIATNATDTHQLYSEVEASHEAMFRGLLATFPTEQADGGEHGSTGQG